ncbi:MAG: YraN family protein [Candidatus Cloacimonadaceae bacterium]|nr:YraN family protein [Candidatus Cloacimonadaceae bacterium]MDP3113691.1 YraN family protein [Candidatus Cloacimonadaceae bacterium]
MDKLTPQDLFHIGEDLAAKYLCSNGYEVLCKNFRTKIGEIDLIVHNHHDLVFVEVKTRSKHSIGDALANISLTKQKRITFSAQEYINQNPYLVKHRVRFDIIVVFYYAHTTTFKIKHFADAFLPVFDDKIT